MPYSIATADVLIGMNSSSVAERRAKIEHEESLLRAERQVQLQAQRSTLNSAHERICLWEKLHRVHLPHNDNHKLLAVIAKETELTLADILHEQARRNAVKSARTLG